jgi:hypothetical protein
VEAAPQVLPAVEPQLPPEEPVPQALPQPEAGHDAPVEPVSASPQTAVVL